MSRSGLPEVAKDHRQTLLLRYRWCGFSMSLLFASVGVLFFLCSGCVVRFFNGMSRGLGFPVDPVQEKSLFLVLTVGYMYLVAALAWMIFRYPAQRWVTLLLIQAKTVSSLLSFFLFFFGRPYLIYLANGAVDGGIALLFLFFYFRIVRRTDEPSA